MFGVNIFKNHIHDKKYSNANQKLSAISHFMMLIQLFACVHPSYLLVLCGVCVFFFSYSFYFVFFRLDFLVFPWILKRPLIRLFQHLKWIPKYERRLWDYV